MHMPAFHRELLLTQPRGAAAAVLVLLVAAGCGSATASRDSTTTTTSGRVTTTTQAPPTTTTTAAPTTSTAAATTSTTTAPGIPAACTRDAGEALVAEFFDALGSGATGLTERFFNPEERFFLYLDPVRGEGEMHRRTGLDAHWQELQAAAVRLKLLAVDSYVHEPENPEGLETGTVLFWLHRDGEVLPGAGKASVDCATGLFERLAISFWALPDESGGTPPDPCSRQAGEAALADFFKVLSSGEAGLAGRFFNPAEHFAGYRDPFGAVAAGDVGGLDQHFAMLQAGGQRAELGEVVDDFAFTWSEGDRLVNLLRFRVQGGTTSGAGRASVDCETGAFLHMTVDEWSG